MFVGVSLNGGTITIIFIKMDITFIEHEKEQRLEHSMDTIFQTSATEIIDCTEIRILFARKPHEGDVRAKGVGDFTSGVKLQIISIQ